MIGLYATKTFMNIRDYGYYGDATRMLIGRGGSNPSYSQSQALDEFHPSHI